MFDFIQGAVQPIIVDALLWGALAVIAWLMRLMPERWRVEIEEKHRLALHKALDTAVGLVLDTAQRHPGIAIPDAAITRGLGYVRNSVPGAIRKLGPSQQQLEAMLRSKLQTALDEATGRDRLAEALKRAGA